MISALAALERLRAGNARFARDVRHREQSARRVSLPDPDATQEPFAIVLGCSDSRVPVEVVFEQGFGDLFVIRVAGNIVAASQIGSVEFAATRFGTRLVVVLGHSRCGAISATLEELQQPTARQSPNLRSIVDRVRPSVETLLATELRDDAEALARHAVRANIRMAAHHLRYGSPVLERLIQRDGLRVVGGEYSLETGVVEFFDGLAEVGQPNVDWPDAEVSQERMRHTEAVASRAGNGQSLSSGQLARVYGFTDLDGSRPDAWRYVVEVQDAGKPADTTGYR